MAFTKHASLEGAQILDIRGSATRIKTASFDKLGDFDAYRTNDGYLYARIRAISSRVNKNYDGWPSIELAGGQDVFDRHLSSEGFTVFADTALKEGFSTFLGKPIFIDHHNSNPKRARGAIVDARLHIDDHKTASLDPYYSSPDVDPEHLPGTWVELLLEVDAKSFPKFAKAIVEGSRNPHKGIDGWSMGCDVKYSKCSVCENKATCPEEYCKHIKMKGAHFDARDKNGQRTSKKAYENCYGCSFFEISGVFDPADETALSRGVVSKSQEETITQDPKKKGLKDEADEQADDYLEETERGIERRKKASNMIACPNCSGMGRHDGNQMCPMCEGMGFFNAPHPGHEGYMTPDEVPEHDATFEPIDYGPLHEGKTASPYDELAQYASVLSPIQQKTVNDLLIHQGPEAAMTYIQETGIRPPEPEVSGLSGMLVTGATKIAENPAPQSDMTHAPEKVDTLRKEQVCPVCGSSMDGDECEVCSYQEPPEGFGNPNLTKAQDADLPTEPSDDPRLDEPGLDPGAGQEPEATNTPKNPALVAHVTSDMDWEIHSEKTSARINKVESPLVATPKPQTNEPQEKILFDQSQPVTSSTVRTATDFIAAVANKENNMKAKVADSAPPSNEPFDKGHHPMDDARNPEKVVDVVGVGGIMDPTNEGASKANGQVDVTGVGGTGVEAVSAGEADGGAEGVKVDQGDEHSKNIESIPTKTWGPGQGDSLGQHEPTTSQTPWWQDSGSGWKGSSWIVESYDDSAFPGDEIESGGAAVEGVQPVDSVGAEERVNVLDHVTSPSNNSGPTKTWTGTDGNGVLKQQDPVTPESIARGESQMEGAPNWTSSAHVFAAFKLARLETQLGMIPGEQEFSRAAELERETPTVLTASLQYAQRVRKAAHKSAGIQKLPVMGRSSGEKVEENRLEKEASSSSEDDSFMFGGV